MKIKNFNNNYILAVLIVVLYGIFLYAILNIQYDRKAVTKEVIETKLGPDSLWILDPVKEFYFIDWGNGLIGIFRASDFSQRANCPVDSLYKTLKSLEYVRPGDKIRLIQLNSSYELNKLRVENGYEPLSTY